MANFNSQKRKNRMTKHKGGSSGGSSGFSAPSSAPAGAPSPTSGAPSFGPSAYPATESYFKIKLPDPTQLEQFALVTQLMGSNQVKAICEDGTERQFRIPGKLLKRVWIRENDVIIVQLWDFQPTKGNVVWRYLGNQVEWLKRNGKLGKLPM